MTAAAGVLGYLGAIDPARIEAARQRAPWRGQPNGAVSGFPGGIVGLGNARIGRHQHLAIAIHGRIDNRDALARDLDCRNDSLIELVAEAYLRHGDAFASHLLGDFAILVLDERRGALLGVRDWVGARPLFWGERGGIVAFGSEVKQVLALLDAPYRVDEATAAEYQVMGNPPITATLTDGVQAVAPSGQVLAISGRASQTTTRPVVFEKLDVSMEEAIELIRARMDAAVERRMHGAERPAALVSGGMDSTSVAATAAMLAQRGVVSPLVAGISLHFPTVPQSDETRYSRDVVERWRIPWRPIAITLDDLTVDPTAYLAVQDGPVYSGIPMFDRMYAEAELQHADVLLTGQGGDIWQDQYGKELAFSLLRREWQTALTWAVDRYKTSPKALLKRTARSMLDIAGGLTESKYYAESGTRYWIIRMAYETEERLGQYHGLRVEFPFCDRELAGALVGLSPSLRSRPGASKLPLRAAMADRLPESVVERLDKSFFDPVMIAAFGRPREGQSTSCMVAEKYLASWRAYLEKGAYPAFPAASVVTR